MVNEAIEAEKLLAKYPGINFVGIRDGYFKDDDAVVADEAEIADGAIFGKEAVK